MAILKLTVITGWSWWRVSLPIAIFVGSNMVYILVGFIYLSLVNIREGPPEDETAFLEDHHHIPHTWISLLFFALFADNLVRWWEGAEGSYWFWRHCHINRSVPQLGQLGAKVRSRRWRFAKPRTMRFEVP